MAKMDTYPFQRGRGKELPPLANADGNLNEPHGTLLGEKNIKSPTKLIE